MANPKHVEVVEQSFANFTQWRQNNLEQLDLTGAELTGADLSGKDLSGAVLIQAKLRNADLREVNLRDATLCSASLVSVNLNNASLDNSNLASAQLLRSSLIGTKLRKADLTLANLYAADLTFANLLGANLREADCTDATFNETKIAGADFFLTKFSSTAFCDLDLAVAVNLEHSVHLSPSTIGLDTIYKSRGRIPTPFLRGCGVPDSLIAYIPSLIGALTPIQYYSCFISYSHKDEDFCKRLYSRLRDENLRVWYAPEEMKSGLKLYEQIDHAIRLHDKLLLVLSEHSMESDWVKTEISNARQREKEEKKQVLFPITLAPFEEIRAWKAFDADIGKDSAKEIREYFIPDFSNWKDHDAFEAAFKRLLADLKRAAE